MKKQPDLKTDEEYAKLGKLLVKAIVRDNINVTHGWWRYIGISFARGLFMGLGSVVGATILVAIAIWLLNAFDWLPLIGEWFDVFSSELKNETPL